MGIIAGALFTVPAYRYLVSDAAGQLTIPFWIVLLAHAAIGLGTLSGGWRIVHTMGSRITRLQPVGGFAAEAAGAVTLFGAAHFGVPVSTTHTITGAIVGVGSLRRLRSVRWNVAGRIVWAWILTIPASGFIATLCWLAIDIARKIFQGLVSGTIIFRAGLPRLCPMSPRRYTRGRHPSANPGRFALPKFL